MADLSNRDHHIMKLKKVIVSLKSERKKLLDSNPNLQNTVVENLNIAINNILTYLEKEKNSNNAPITRINQAIIAVLYYKN